MEASPRLQVRKKRNRTWLYALGAVVLLIGAGAFWLNRQSARAFQEEQRKRIVKAEAHDIRKELVLTGKVMPSGSASVYAPVSGQLTEILVKEGQRVKQGQDLFIVLQDTVGQHDLDARRAEVDKAKLELQNTQENLARRKGVRDLFTEAENRELELNFERRRLEFAAARERLALLETNLGIAGRRRPGAAVAGGTSKIYVKAPRAGLVTYISKFVGERVFGTVETAEAKGREVLIIADDEKMIVRSRILEADLAAVKLGHAASIKLDAFRDKEYAGTVTRISQQGIEDSTAGYTFFETDIAIEKPDADVRASMNSSIVLVLEEKKGVLSLPTSAVASLNGHSVIELPREGKGAEVKYRQIKTGLANEQYVEVLEDSVKPGDEVLKLDFATLDLTELAKGTLGKAE